MTRKHPSTRTMLSISALTLLFTSALLYAGPLTPPAGPISSTPKPLTEVEPRIAINAANTPGDADSLFKITQPGSYYLTGNITGVAGKHGIEITASGVTLDLNGFDLLGVPAMGAFDGVSVTVSSLTNIAVINGSVRNWGDDGIDLGTLTASNCRVEDVQASGNTGTGISVGSVTIVDRCVARSNISNGISTGAACVVTRCVGFSNSGSGVTLGIGGVITDCSANSNSLDGIRCVASCLVRGNTCSSNGNGAGDGAGIHATSGDNRIEGNNCVGADRGIDVDVAGNIIIKNTCSGNTINWVIAASNYYGPIIDRTGVVTAAVNGPAAAGTLVTTDPHANFSY